MAGSTRDAVKAAGVYRPERGTLGRLIGPERGLKLSRQRVGRRRNVGDLAGRRLTTMPQTYAHSPVHRATARHVRRSSRAPWADLIAEAHRLSGTAFCLGFESFGEALRRVDDDVRESMNEEAARGFRS